MNGGGTPQVKPRRGLLLSAVLTAGLLALIPSPAFACDPTDVGCVVEKAEDTVGDVQGEVEGAQDQVEEVVSDPVGSVEEVVTETEKAAEELVDRTVGAPDAKAPDPDSVSGSTNPGDPGGPGRGRARDGRRDRRGSRPSTARSRDRDTIQSREGATAAGERLVGAAAPDASPLTTPEDGLGDAARRFAFPLLLSALVGLFLFFEGRTSRRDPKLVLAPLDTEMLTFE